ncbi:hypothetical protein QBC44DRAFT_370730 [Cladorrhinum sp. PSN332]|nr:hypothetical protein QBC44DRAFT_370730 [Cladorrhinum sp. PSN332]
MSAVTPMRQSCDRCHGQKLRCQRSGDRDTGACQRCIRQGSQCVYSTSLPKGRPSQYSQNQADQTDSAASAGGLPSSKRACRTTPPISPQTKPQRRPRAASRTNSSTSKIASVTNNIVISPPATTITATATAKDGDTTSVVTAMPGGVSSDSMSTTASSSAWPWQGIFSWGDLELDGNGNGSGSGNDQLQDLNESQWPATASGLAVHHDAMPDVFAANANQDDQQLMDWTDADIGDPYQLGPAPTRLALELGLGAFDHGFNSNNNDGGKANLLNSMTPNTPNTPNDVGTGIVQLTQLSARLCPLHGLVLAAVEKMGPGGVVNCLPEQKENNNLQPQHRQSQDPIADKFAFKSIMAQLLDDTGTPTVERSASVCNSKQEVFDASREFLGILRCLQTQARPGLSSSGSVRYSPATPVATPSAVGSAANGGGSGSNTVIRHLIMACHGMLLSIYATILGALQRDADLILSDGHAQAPGMATAIEAGSETLTDIRLVMIVQLCSYLIGRQQQAVDSHLLWLQQQDDASFNRLNMLPNDLEVEVQQRLTRIRQTLRIA